MISPLALIVRHVPRGPSLQRAVGDTPIKREQNPRKVPVVM